MLPNGLSINIGELSKPVTVLIEKISNAIGGIAAPWQLKRIATAEAEVQQIKNLAEIKSDLQLRALNRFLREEGLKQFNMEKIAQVAFPMIQLDAAPERMENDWIVNFFDKCRLISDEQMQDLWSKILAGEANSPGRYSRRTVDLLSTLDKMDAQSFTQLCSFVWMVEEPIPLVFDVLNPIYTDQGITFSALMHLDEIGLASFEGVTGFSQINVARNFDVSYFGQRFKLEFAKPEKNRFNIGKVMLSKAGKELALVCNSKPILGFKEYVIKIWGDEGITIREMVPV